jgi:hypothetical protein
MSSKHPDLSVVLLVLLVEVFVLLDVLVELLALLDVLLLVLVELLVAPVVDDVVVLVDVLVAVVDVVGGSVAVVVVTAMVVVVVAQPPSGLQASRQLVKDGHGVLLPGLSLHCVADTTRQVVSPFLVRSHGIRPCCPHVELAIEARSSERQDFENPFAS